MAAAADTVAERWWELRQRRIARRAAKVQATLPPLAHTASALARQGALTQIKALGVQRLLCVQLGF
jgi:hypothetical protein